MNPWFERDPDRYASERGFWADNGFAEEKSGGLIRFVGIVEVHAGGDEGGAARCEFKVRITYPAGFPFRYPDVDFIDPRIRRARHQSPAGVPCLFPPREWTQFVPASEVHDALRRWLRSWMRSSFPRELAIYELPEYFPPSSLTVLVSPDAFEAFAGKDRGTFGVVCASGRDLGVLKSVDRSSVADELLHGLRLGSEVMQKIRNGKWFRLPDEPAPMRHTGELSTALARNGHSFNAGRAPTEHGLVGLVFADAVLQEERLLLLDYASGRRSRPAPQGWPIRAPAAYVISHEELYRRLEGVRDPEALKESIVVVLGAGAIGSSLTLDLVREGVGGLVVCDPDELRPGNVMRHALDLFAVGQRKAEAVETATGRIDPFAETWTETDGLGDPDVLANLMRADHPVHPANLVISAIGDDVIETLVSEVAVREVSAPVLFVRTLHDGDLVRIMLLRPGGDDPCLECLRLHAERGTPDFIDVPHSELEPVFDNGCATSAQPGAGLASRQAAVLGAKKALAVLLGAADDNNHWVWVDRAIPEAEDSRLHTAETMYSMRLPRHDDCSVCARDV